MLQAIAQSSNARACLARLSLPVQMAVERSCRLISTHEAGLLGGCTSDADSGPCFPRSIRLPDVGAISFFGVGGSFGAILMGADPSRNGRPCSRIAFSIRCVAARQPGSSQLLKGLMRIHGTCLPRADIWRDGGSSLKEKMRTVAPSVCLPIEEISGRRSAVCSSYPPAIVDGPPSPGWPHSRSGQSRLSA